MSRLPTASTFMLLALLLPGTPLAGQVCLGIPVGQERVTLEAGRRSSGLSRSWEGRFQGNLGGKVSLGAGFALDSFDDLSEDGFTTRLRVATPRSVWRLAFCPVVALEYSELTLRTAGGDPENTLKGFVIAPGVGLGAEIPLGDDAGLTFHGTPRVLLMSGSHARIRGGNGEAEPSGRTQLGFVAGAALRIRDVYLGGELTASTLREGEAATRIRIGFIR